MYDEDGAAVTFGSRERHESRDQSLNGSGYSSVVLHRSEGRSDYLGQDNAVEDWSNALGALGLGNEASPQPAQMQDVGEEEHSFSMPSRGGTAMTGLTGQFGDADVSAISEVLDHSLDDSLDMERPSGGGGGARGIRGGGRAAVTAATTAAAAAAPSTSQNRIAQLRQEQQELRVKLVMTEAAEERNVLAERLQRATAEIDHLST
jgi:hypothetical protein